MHHDSTITSSLAQRPTDGTALSAVPRQTPAIMKIGPVSLAPVTLRSPAVMSQGELARWAQIGRNAVPRLVEQYGIREITRQQRHQRYSVTDVLARILNINPSDADEEQQLLIPLQTTDWVAQMTGRSRSTLSERARLGGLPYRAIDLFATSAAQGASRCRRWIAAQVVADLTGVPLPFLEQDQCDREPNIQPSGNGFAALWHGTAGEARQCQR